MKASSNFHEAAPLPSSRAFTHNFSRLSRPRPLLLVQTFQRRTNELSSQFAKRTSSEKRVVDFVERFLLERATFSIVRFNRRIDFPSPSPRSSTDEYIHKAKKFSMILIRSLIHGMSYSRDRICTIKNFLEIFTRDIFPLETNGSHFGDILNEAIIERRIIKMRNSGIFFFLRACER